jgi:flagellar FliL protein
MSEDKAKAAEVSEEKPPKSPVVKIVVLVVAVILLMAIAVGATLYATGVFSGKPHEDEDALVEEGEGGHGEAKGGHGAAKGGHGEAKGGHGEAKGGHGEAKGGHGEAKKDETPKKKAIPADKDTRFEKSYMDLDDKKPLVANISGSRKVMQVSLSLMTQYDDRVFKNVEKHRAALRSGALDVLRQVTEADLAKPDFRNELAVKLREKINAELERLENFGGIEEVFFSEFVFQ